MESNTEELKYPVGKYKAPGSFTPELIKEWISTLKALPAWMDACIENLD